MINTSLEDEIDELLASMDNIEAKQIEILQRWEALIWSEATLEAGEKLVNRTPSAEQILEQLKAVEDSE